MPRIPGLRRAFALPFVRRRVRRDVDDEFAFHLEMRTAELVDRGWTPAAARQEALRQFGDVADAREYCHAADVRRGRRTMRAELSQILRQDLFYAARTLLKSPGFTAIAVATLALGVGANVTMFGIVDRLLLRSPAHVTDADAVKRLYFTQLSDGQPETDPQISWPTYVAVRDRLESADGIAAFMQVTLPLGAGELARPSQIEVVTPSYFSVLRARPAAGRFLVPSDDETPAATRVAVISDDLWRVRFGSAPNVIGQSLTIGGQPFEVVGIAPPGFTGAGLERVDAWVPIGTLAPEIVGAFVDVPWYEARNIGWIRAILRADDGSETRVAEEAGAGYRAALAARFGEARADSLGASASLEPLLLERGPDRTPSSRIALWLAGMSVIVLLIACANVANLLLARALRRRREIAVRVALGAGRGRLIAQLLTESVLLALLGFVGAVFVAWWSSGFVGRTLLPDVAWRESLFDARLLLVAGTIAVVVGLLTGLVPALQVRDATLVDALKTGARDGGGQRRGTRSALVAVQAALSLVLLVGAGLFLRSLHAARSVELGFDASRVLTVEPDFTGTGYSSEETMRIYDRLHERVAAIPGVRHASLGLTQPFSTTITLDLRLPGRDTLRLPASEEPEINIVTPEFFATMGTRVVAGRSFTADDRPGAPPVMMVNERLARRLWPGRSPLGECVILPDLDGEPCVGVIGIAADARLEDLRGDPPLQLYLALDQELWTELPLRTLFVRTDAPTPAIAGALRAAVSEVAPQVAYTEIETLAENIEPELRPWRLGATMFTVFGALALVLAGIGLYGVIAYDVAQRMHEMGVRLALGARPGDVIRLIVTHGLRIVAVGIAAGAAIALIGSRWIGTMLFETAPRDPLVMISVAALLLIVAVLACLVPASRATRVSPSLALRAE